MASRYAGTLSLLIAMFYSEAAFAGPDLCQLLAPCNVPSKFRSGPFLAPPMIHEVKLRQIQTICAGRNKSDAQSGSDGQFLGCAQLTAKRCEVHVPVDVKVISEELFSKVLAHELAHCRGWVHRRF